MRTLLTLKKTKYSVTIKTKSRMQDGFRGDFYVLVHPLLEFLKSESQSVIFRDKRTFLEINRCNNKLLLEFMWLQSNGHSVQYKQERIYIKRDEFEDFCINAVDGDICKTLNVKEDRKGKITFSESGLATLKEVLSNPIAKKKFVKALVRRFDCRDGNVVFHSDYNKYDFFWQYESGYHGGLILRNISEGASKAYYSIHT